MNSARWMVFVSLLAVAVAGGCRREDEAAGGAGGAPADPQADPVATYLARLTEAVDLDNKEAALSWCQRLEPIAPADHDEALLQMGRAYLLDGQASKALDYLNRARALQVERLGANSNRVGQTDRIIQQCNTQIGQENTRKFVSAGKGGVHDLVTSRMSDPEKLTYYLEGLETALEKKEMDKAGQLATRLQALAADRPEADALLGAYYLATQKYAEAEPLLLRQLYRLIEQNGKFDRGVLPLLRDLRMLLDQTGRAAAGMNLTGWENAILLEERQPQAGMTDAARIDLCLTNAGNALQRMNTRIALQWCGVVDEAAGRPPAATLRLARLYDLIGYDVKAIRFYSEFINQSAGTASSELLEALTSLKLLMLGSGRQEEMLPVMMKWVACMEAVHGADHAYAAMAREELSAFRLHLESRPTTGNGAAVQGNGVAERSGPVDVAAINQANEGLKQAQKMNNVQSVMQWGVMLEPLIQQDPARLYQLGLAYSRIGANDRAVAVLSASAQEYFRQMGPDCYQASTPLKRLVELYGDQKQYAAAVGCLEQLVAINEKKWGAADEKTVALRKQAEETRAKIGDSLLTTGTPPSANRTAGPPPLVPGPPMMGMTAGPAGAADPQEAVRIFMRGLIARQPDLILDVTLPNCNAYLLWTVNEPLTPELQAEALKLIESVQAVSCRPGESILLPNGRKVEIVESMTLDGRRPVLAVVPGGSDTPVFWVHKIEPARWVVDASPLTEQLKRVLAAREK